MTARVLELSAKLAASIADTAIVPPAVGIHAGVDFDTYHAWNALSNSRLSKFKRSPAHLQAYLRGELDDDTSAKAGGRALHCAVLEPDVFAARYMVAEQCEAITQQKKRCSKMGSIYSGTDGWLCGTHGGDHQQQPGVSVLGPDDHARVLRMRDKVFAHPKARALLTNQARHELSLLWHDEPTDVLCKARLDSHTPAILRGVTVDLKRCVDASPSAFERAVFRYGYQRQAYLYLTGAERSGLDAQDFVNIAVEPEPPHNVGIYRMNEAAIAAGEQEVRALMARYADCLATDTWPGYSADIEDVALPAYAWGAIDQEYPSA